jgi:hydroxymethylbilane synthase
VTADLRIATRRSALAMAQARQVAERLRDAHPGLEVELVPVVSSGDLDTTTNVTALTEVGAFVRALQREVLEGRADLAVHSCKDLPVAGPEELEIVAYPPREDPRDALVGGKLADLAPGARVGTGSPRRAAQLQLLRADLRPTPIRGNVDTRIAKMARGEVAACLLALAGLRRLGRAGDAHQVLEVAEMVPAPAQGALAVEARRGSPAAALTAAIDHPSTRAAVEAERELLARTGAGCRAALAALAEVHSGAIRMETFVADERGPRRATVEGADGREAAAAAIEELGL